MAVHPHLNLCLGGSSLLTLFTSMLRMLFRVRDAISFSSLDCFLGYTPPIRNSAISKIDRVSLFFFSKAPPFQQGSASLYRHDMTYPNANHSFLSCLNLKLFGTVVYCWHNGPSAHVGPQQTVGGVARFQNECVSECRPMGQQDMC